MFNGGLVQYHSFVYNILTETTSEYPTSYKVEHHEWSRFKVFFYYKEGRNSRAQGGAEFTIQGRYTSFFMFGKRGSFLRHIGKRWQLNLIDLQDKKKDAVKKVIAAMTVGKDVSMLFTDVVNCMQTENLELKKLVYLYLINYAKSQPDLAILAVNTFVKVGVLGNIAVS